MASDAAQLAAVIAALRTARDNAAQAAEKTREIGAIEFAKKLDELAGKYDALLAHALRAAGTPPPEPPAVEYPLT